MPRIAPTVDLDQKQRARLDALLRSPTTPQSLVLRARIVIAAADGWENIQISEDLGVPPVTVGKWRRAFAQNGFKGLQDAPRSGRPSKYGPEVRRKIQTAVCQQPEHQGRWTVRTLARELDLPRTKVHEVLLDSHLQPHRIRTFTFSPDPDFEAKLLDIVGLYMDPPDNALVLCVDEKSGIQALDRTQPVLPLRGEKPRAWTNEYKRNGTQALLAALDIATGRVVAHVRNQRTSRDFLNFMNEVVRQYPKQRLEVILDNLNTHTNEAAQRWLKRHPLVQFHYTPKHASWTNLIEVFFSVLGRQGLSQCVHQSAAHLRRFLLDYIETYNESCGPFTWTKGPEHLQRIIEATAEYQATNPPKRKRPKIRKNKRRN